MLTYQAPRLGLRSAAMAVARARSPEARAARAAAFRRVTNSAGSPA